MKIYKNFQELANTSEAYSRLTIINGNTVIIPYINLQLMPANPITDKSCFIDFSYLVFRHVFEIVEDNNKFFFFDLAFDSDNSNFIEEDIQVNNWEFINGIEMNVKCQGVELYLRDNYAIDSNYPFVPYITPNYSPNVDHDEVERFFSRESLRQSIIEILK